MPDVPRHAREHALGGIDSTGPTSVPAPSGRGAARLASLGSTRITPSATAGRPEDTDRAATAELIRGGMALVDVEGFLTVTRQRGLPAESPAYGPSTPSRSRCWTL
ncbi:hypothetical protein ACFWVP_21555 [Streptomyces sp. NPDC058637]|uniref:hypothetical protein n=1 Tax=Streptomyces sp. NPDC058637 TaxID=3346569 RepID=UPI00365113CC